MRKRSSRYTKFTESKLGERRSAGLGGIPKFATARSTAYWFPLVGGRERSIRERKMPWNGLGAPLTLRREDCAKHWMQAAAGAGVQGGPCEPSSSAQTRASLLVRPWRK